MTEHLDKLPFEDYCKTIFNKDALFDKPEALNGYRVLSCTQYILGPCAAAYLGELGAEVIKIEVPRLGEPMRHCSPYNETWFYPVSRWNPGRGTSRPSRAQPQRILLHPGLPANRKPRKSSTTWCKNPMPWCGTTGPAPSTAGRSATAPAKRSIPASC